MQAYRISSIRDSARHATHKMHTRVQILYLWDADQSSEWVDMGIHSASQVRKPSNNILILEALKSARIQNKSGLGVENDNISHSKI